ncbi:MAG: hypothetical protein WEF50_21765 [Myxococcota bacterium]
MIAVLRASAAAGALLTLTACLDPSDRRPGTWLSGEVAAELPSDWSFTDAHKEIAIEVATPYFVPHSVTIWCAALDGALYVGARDPDTKRWPAWADADPQVRLGIDGKVYEVALVPLDEQVDVAELARLRAVYAVKYARPPAPADAPPGSIPPTRYWRVGPRG